jgi:hypothetical protein
VTVRYPSLEDYLHTAAFVLGLPMETVVKASGWTLPSPRCMRPKPAGAAWSSYPSFAMKAAVLLVRLTKNHALPDGNSAPRWPPRSRSAT